MGRLKNKFYQFMYGRYGPDALGKFLLWVSVILMLVFSIVMIFVNSVWLYIAYWACSSALGAWIISRMFSKNIVARRKENEKFCNFFKLRRNKFRDRKTHVYRKCPDCKVVLRLPKAKGKHFVVCPNCKNRFKVRG